MGNQRQFNPEGGFTQYLYEKVPKYDTVTINGVKAKVIREIGDTDGHSSLPTYTDKADMYLKEGKSGDVIQARYYGKDRRVLFDIDWGHGHHNDPKAGGNGKTFENGVAHVQLYAVDGQGELVRLSNKARYMNNEEMKKFKDIIRHYNPNVKFRPGRKKTDKKEVR